MRRRGDGVGLLFVRKWVGGYSFAWDSALLVFCSLLCAATRLAHVGIDLAECS
jgi:hypothetical protein